MKSFKKWVFSGLLFMIVSTVFSQGKVSGTITDSELKQALPGATVSVKGSNEAVVTDADGKFIVNVPNSKGELVISYIGFESKTMNFNVPSGTTVNLGTIILASSANDLEEVIIVGKGVIDLAKERKTPIAVSTIRAAEIQAKIGTSDITQTLVNTPSVYVAGQAGGFGDSRISVRGFQQDNTAFLLNGQPINGMEDGKMYWSNWSGMADIANAIQIQRGLGSSKLAISSVGGTVNFVTKATDLKEGGFVSTGVANDDYYKTTVAYNTGMSKKGWGASFMVSNWEGDGYNQGSFGQGQNYFLSVGYKASDKHSLNFLLTGAPQSHDQNFTKSISSYLTYGKKYNNNYGFLNGKYISERVNFYHKPVANFNWDYKINEKMDLSTVLYASWGRGGGTGNYGRGKILTADGHIDFDQIYANNIADSDGIGSQESSDPYRNKNYVIRTSVNNHEWYGVVSNLKTKLTENLALNFGLDLRTYKGTHYRQVTNFLGLNAWTETRPLRGDDDIPTATIISNTVNQSLSANAWNSTFKSIDDNQKIDYDYSEEISYGGVFGQLEYSNSNFSAFFQGSVSNQAHQRFDRYDYLPEFEESDKVNNTGFNVKGGASYKAGNHSFYVNAGYYDRQPYHDNVYLDFTNRVNPFASNEKILGLEAGYNFKNKNLNVSVNGFRTSWKDRVVSSSRTVSLAAGEIIGTTPLAFGDLVYKSNLGVEQIHTGIELDFTYKITDKLDVKGFGSLGNYEYKGTSLTRETDDNQNLLKETLVDVDGGKVGDAAQTTFGLGAKYEIFTRFTVDADWRNYDKLYANVGAVKNNLELPTYDLVDAGVSYKWLVGKNKTNSVIFRVNINNVFDEVYLSELTSNIKTTDNIPAVAPNASIGTYQNNGRVYKGIADGNQGYFGFGRTWNFSLRYNF